MTPKKTRETLHISKLSKKDKNAVLEASKGNSILSYMLLMNEPITAEVYADLEYGMSVDDLDAEATSEIPGILLKLRDEEK